jgi:Tfp pilus assembly protein PilV
MNCAMKLPRQHRRSGVALIIVLAFVVLLLVLALAYFTRTVTDRQVAQSSFRQTNADQLALSAADVIVADLKQEIVNGSASPVTFGPSTSPGPYYLYAPSPSANILPMRSPTPAAGTTIPNLVRRSARAEPSRWPNSTSGPALGSRASAVNSTGDASANGRSITLARWNSHYLVPKSSNSDTTSNPITTGFTLPNAWAPDWVYVTDKGPTVITSPSTSVIGRYAYAIYDESGLLDMNAAGYPSPTTITQYGRKGSLAFADLTGLGSFGLSTTGIDTLVGWRNYASSQPTGDFSSNFSFNTAAANTYYNFILSDPNYIKLTTYSPNYFLTTSQAPAYNNRTDQVFTNRQELIKFIGAIPGPTPQNALQYLGTSSREASAGIPQLTWPSPTPSPSINPNFQTLWVSPSPFPRNDGTTANKGDYLVNKRFLLQRLNWLTYEGPSASRDGIVNTNPLDADLALLMSRFGLTKAFLQQGTPTNIQNYFGLVWNTTYERWNYVGPSGSYDTEFY